MKKSKTIYILLLVMSMVLALCACGDSTEEEASDVSDSFEVVTPAPTEEPEEPEEAEEEPEEEEIAGVVKDDITGVTLNQATTEDKKSIAEEYLYQDVNLLYAAIGYPDSTAYSAGCMGGDDGQLFYDGFEVQTRVNPDNGDEIIMGVY